MGRSAKKFAMLCGACGVRLYCHWLYVSRRPKPTRVNCSHKYSETQLGRAHEYSLFRDRAFFRRRDAEMGIIRKTVHALILSRSSIVAREYPIESRHSLF